ncbi:uncharacterized protein LOC133876254 [Alnus glutinosa]|uniref:uncharacterized protein LOC133876254 n=1 Tax=Alnus glutinosa TaxID=3517 RepID=UPI002D7725E4|nr:uncharacterized protein LOC133876254 [Alnus glutinosa]
MAHNKLVVEVHFGGRFDQSFGCEYTGGEVELHKDSVDLDKLSFFEIEDICKEYGYKLGDLIYFKDPVKSLADGLHLITSDHDVLKLFACHDGHAILQLYIVSFGDGGGDEEDSQDDNEYGGRADLDDPWWDDKLSDTEDVFDVGVDVDSSGPSNVQHDNPRVEQGNVEDNEGGNDENSEEGGNDENSEDGEEGDEKYEEGGDDENSEEGGNGDNEDEVGHDDDDNNSDMARSDILVSPVASDEEVENSESRGSEFHAVDREDPSLEVKMRFPDIQTFREVVRVFNLKRGKDITFKKNERKKCIVVCKEPKCNYRVYARQVDDEATFQIISLQGRHVCGRQFRNSIVNSTWIADKLIDKFRVQPDMPLHMIQNEVQERWRIDVNPSMMYRTRIKANKKIYGNHGGQYAALWDYCETLRATNPGSCVVMKVDRTVPEANPRFQRLYCSLAAMKKGFLEGCRPVIGVDGCFLKGPFKGQLLAAVGRDGNDNMYLIAYAVVEAETKDSWI